MFLHQETLLDSVFHHSLCPWSWRTCPREPCNDNYTLEVQQFINYYLHVHIWSWSLQHLHPLILCQLSISILISDVEELCNLNEDKTIIFVFSVNLIRRSDLLFPSFSLLLTDTVEPRLIHACFYLCEDVLGDESYMTLLHTDVLTTEDWCRGGRLWSWRFNCNKQGIWWMVIIYMRLLLVNLGVQLFQRHLIFVHCWLCAVITLSHSFSSIFHPLSVDICETKLLTWLKSRIRTDLDNITLDIISKVTVN